MKNKSFLENPSYWDNRYQNFNDTWSLNTPNPVFVHLLNSKKFPLKNRLLVLGCGKGHDACFASELNYSVTGIDFSNEAITSAKASCNNKANSPEFLSQDIFDLNKNEQKFDVVYEYATFCSIPPDKIKSLLEIINSILENDGYFITILFPINELNFAPPNAINYFDFVKMAKKYFQLSYFQKDINSIKPRKGNEVLLIFKKAK